MNETTKSSKVKKQVQKNSKQNTVGSSQNSPKCFIDLCKATLRCNLTNANFNKISKISKI